MNEQDFGYVKFKSSRRPTFIYILILLLLIIGGGYYVFKKVVPAPADFPAEKLLLIPEGSSMKTISKQLETEHIVRSPFLFDIFAILLGGDRKVNSGYYAFNTPIPVYEVARRVVRGDRQIPQYKVTIPEGFTRAQIADAVAEKLLDFNKELFLDLTKNKEGYLFPDTYFFFPFSKEEDVATKLSETFDKKIATVQSDIDSSGKKLSDIIVMASIIEEESSGKGDRTLIAGILWKRLEKGIALQVDTAPETYNRKGLPSMPITNPGLDSIIATLRPESSPYLFYLHDKNGDIHYAKTFDEHKKNIAKYLK
jgi:UPF0755 protein